MRFVSCPPNVDKDYKYVMLSHIIVMGWVEESWVRYGMKKTYTSPPRDLSLRIRSTGFLCQMDADGYRLMQLEANGYNWKQMDVDGYKLM